MSILNHSIPHFRLLISRQFTGDLIVGEVIVCITWNHSLFNTEHLSSINIATVCMKISNFGISNGGPVNQNRTLNFIVGEKNTHGVSNSGSVYQNRK